MKRKRKKRTSTKYPNHLYPKRNYHLIPSNCKKIQDLYLLRLMAQSSMPEKGIIDMALMQKYMDYHHFLNGMSCNLLSIYRKADAKYWITNKALNDYWCEGLANSNVEVSDFVTVNNPGYFGFRISDIKQINSAYSVCDERGRTIRRDRIQCEVQHCPTISNFWHYNIVLYGIDDTSGKEHKYLLKDAVGKKKFSILAKSLMPEFFNILAKDLDMTSKRISESLYKYNKGWKRWLNNTK